jgi:hypothetical protein
MPACWSIPPELRQMIVKVRYAMVNKVTRDVGKRIDLFVERRGMGFGVVVGGEYGFLSSRFMVKFVAGDE